jgi:hypothetical protein
MRLSCCSVHRENQQSSVPLLPLHAVVPRDVLPAGYDEAAATAPERLLAHTLQEVLLLHSPTGSSMYPVTVDEEDASETFLHAQWPKSTLKRVLEAAQQPYRVADFKQYLAGALKRQNGGILCIAVCLMNSLSCRATRCL